MSDPRVFREVRTGTRLSDAVRQAYARGEDDELMEPLVAVDPCGAPRGRIRRGDSVVFYNIRGEREFELTRALADPAFSHFPRPDALPGRNGDDDRIRERPAGPRGLPGP